MRPGKICVILKIIVTAIFTRKKNTTFWSAWKKKSVNQENFEGLFDSNMDKICLGINSWRNSFLEKGHFAKGNFDRRFKDSNRFIWILSNESIQIKHLSQKNAPVLYRDLKVIEWFLFRFIWKVNMVKLLWFKTGLLHIYFYWL